MDFTDLYSQVLGTLRSNSFAEMSDDQLTNYFDDLAIRAIADFRFPKISLSYSITTDAYGNDVYSFENDITQYEINVLIVLMKKFWIEMQMDDENHYAVLYYDRDVKTSAGASMVNSMNKRYDTAKQEAKTAQYNYSRIDSKGNIGVGSVYDDSV